MKKEILKLLKYNKDNFVSGQKISEKLGVSRAAIWKYMKSIKEDGYEVESVSRKGYRLVSSPDILTLQELEKYQNTKYIGRKILHFDTIDSTNTKAKEIARLGEEEGTMVISEEQTLGRGRLGRQWVSPKYKGIWMSLILKPDINPAYVSRITLIGAAAVNKAIGEMGINTYIKWPNDIILDNKKVCGILTEMSGELDKINYIIMGIGVNVNTNDDEFPDEISEIATSIKIHYGKKFNRKELVGRILNNFEQLYDNFVNHGDISETIKICRENSVLIGKEVRVIKRGEECIAHAIDLNEEGQLVVKYEDGNIEALISGEVSMRGLNGYV